MANNLAPYLLRQISDISGSAAPENKIMLPGFLNFLKSQNPFDISVKSYDGTKREVRVGYAQRFTPADTRTSKSCDITVQPSELETTVSVANTRQLAIHLDDELIAQYTEDASQMQTVGKPATDIMMKMYQNLKRAANALLNAVDQDLLTLASATIGKNKATGSAAAQTININKDGTVNSMTDGFTKILADYQLNEFYGKPALVGSGLMNNFMIQRMALGLNQAGFNGAILADQLDWYYDQNAATILGTNKVVAYEPGAVQLIEYLEYTGPKAGKKPGASTFGIISLPVQTVNGIVPVEFDFQLRYNDCDASFTDGYTGQSIALHKGYNMILSKQFGLFSIPTDAYKFYDDLTGNRGSLLFTISNDCVTC